MSMMVARDAAAADQLVYPYPFSVGPVVEVACNADEVAVVCPAWAVGGLLGPGRHQWQSPEPNKPSAIYFVLTGPVDVEFDMVSQFALPGTGVPITLRASGSVLVRVADPGMLIAQFVGLPFDRVNDGLKFSIAQSVERLLGKVLPRKAAMAGTAKAVTDRTVRQALIDELSSYNPGIGAVYGLQFVRFATLDVVQVGANLQPQEVSGWIGGRGDDLVASDDSTAKGPAPVAVPDAAVELAAVAAAAVAAASAPAITVPPAPVEVPALAKGTRVLVSMADGLLHAGTVRQAMQGYYELEVGGCDQPLWVAQNQVTPQL